ncbi:MAG: flagellar basal body-associated FliL family protein [Methyloversatilis sp.]|nr:flagellar basal body-associated FliL family protein [Methyloversatilis sp.]MBP6194408.1 flagellar basal body-associated FliL family protein [Methyloversatilis sp.]MBP9117127.1 flagellar basal body-associated FliL family protein [Methyloversatilis sp.]
MSKAATADDAGAEAPKKSKKMLIIIIAVLVLVIVGGAAAFFMMGSAHPEEGDEEHAEESMSEEELDAKDKAAKKAKLKKKKEAEAKGLPPVFVELEPFTVNLQAESAADQYLQIKASLKMEDQAAADSLKAYMPEIRHHALMLLSGKKASELSNTEGREALALEFKNSVNTIVGEVPTNRKGEPEEPIGPVEAVLFTSFIVQ